jgi:hypothetical protein
VVQVIINIGIVFLNSDSTSAPLVEGALKLLRFLYEEGSVIGPAANAYG